MVTVLVAVGVAAAAPAVSEEGGRSRYVEYSVAHNSRGGWRGTGQGDVEFFNKQRRFRLYGEVSENRGTDQHCASLSTHSVYVSFKQNVRSSSNDGRWYTIDTSNTDGKLDYYDNNDISTICYYTIGYSDAGEYYQWPTRPGHGLSGIWLRICRRMDGPDSCGAQRYVDNPFVPGRNP